MPILSIHNPLTKIIKTIRGKEGNDQKRSHKPIKLPDFSISSLPKEKLLYTKPVAVQEQYQPNSTRKSKIKVINSTKTSSEKRQPSLSEQLFILSSIGMIGVLAWVKPELGNKEESPQKQQAEHYGKSFTLLCQPEKPDLNPVKKLIDRFANPKQDKLFVYEYSALDSNLSKVQINGKLPQSFITGLTASTKKDSFPQRNLQSDVQNEFSLPTPITLSQGTSLTEACKTVKNLYKESVLVPFYSGQTSKRPFINNPVNSDFQIPLHSITK